jgi:DNA mismatch endonuclease (patch repair protein)
MTDVFDKETRSRVMSRIHGKDTGPERLVSSHLHAAGFRFRRCVRSLPGAPDFAIKRSRMAIFVHGCFWHSHTGCRYSVKPKSNESFWLGKLERTVKRDRAALMALKKMGFRVAVVWECSLRDAARRDRALERLCRWAKNGKRSMEL